VHGPASSLTLMPFPNAPSGLPSISAIAGISVTTRISSLRRRKPSDKVAAFGGSWTFIIIFSAILLSWVLLNTLILARHSESFDPYPYILLNLFLSMLAAVQAPIILMAQNRQGVKDRLDATHDYEVNLKAELEILSLHDKIDELREMKWAELITMQQEQIRLLTQLITARGMAGGQTHPPC